MPFWIFQFGINLIRLLHFDANNMCLACSEMVDYGGTAAPHLRATSCGSHNPTLPDETVVDLRQGSTSYSLNISLCHRSLRIRIQPSRLSDADSFQAERTYPTLAGSATITSQDTSKQRNSRQHVLVRYEATSIPTSDGDSHKPGFKKAVDRTKTQVMMKTGEPAHPLRSSPPTTDELAFGIQAR